MISYDDIRTAIVAWVSSETGDTCIKAEGNGQKPAKPFFTYRLDAFVDEAEDYIGSPDEVTGDVTITGNRAFTCAIAGYGDGVLQKLRDLKSSTRKPSVLDTFRAASIVIVNRLSITNITGLDQADFEERGVLELIMRVENVITDTGSIIENVNGTGTIENFPPLPDHTIDLGVTTP